ncbi:unnamed protein product, partial [Scytosiphon promiscuus]
ENTSALCFVPPASIVQDLEKDTYTHRPRVPKIDASFGLFRRKSMARFKQTARKTIKTRRNSNKIGSDRNGSRISDGNAPSYPRRRSSGPPPLERDVRDNNRNKGKNNGGKCGDDRNPTTAKQKRRFRPGRRAL